MISHATHLDELGQSWIDLAAEHRRMANALRATEPASAVLADLDAAQFAVRGLAIAVEGPNAGADRLFETPLRLLAGLRMADWPEREADIGLLRRLKATAPNVPVEEAAAADEAVARIFERVREEMTPAGHQARWMRFWTEARKILSAAQALAPSDADVVSQKAQRFLSAASMAVWTLWTERRLPIRSQRSLTDSWDRLAGHCGPEARDEDLLWAIQRLDDLRAEAKADPDFAATITANDWEQLEGDMGHLFNALETILSPADQPLTHTDSIA